MIDALVQHIENEIEISAHNYRILCLCTFWRQREALQKRQNHYLKAKNVYARIKPEHRHFLLRETVPGGRALRSNLKIDLPKEEAPERSFLF